MHRQLRLFISVSVAFFSTRVYFGNLLYVFDNVNDWNFNDYLIIDS